MKKLLICLLLGLLLGGCSIHKLEIQQGNVLIQEMIDALKPGMTRQKVEFILGTAPLKDPFHSERWDYIYILKRHDEAPQYQRLSLFFDGEGKLARLEQIPAAGPDR